MEKTIFFLRGLPGTGKTTLCKELLKYGAHLKVKVLSRDIIRERIKKGHQLIEWSYDTGSEEIVTKIFREELAGWLLDKEIQWIIIDNSNLSFERAVELEEIIHKVNRYKIPLLEVKVVLLQLGAWMSKMRQHPKITMECEEKMRKEMGDSGMYYMKHCEQINNWWFFNCKSWSDESLCSGSVPFDWKWKTPFIGGWTKATTDIICNFFDPTLEHKPAETCGLFFQPYSKVYSTYFSIQ